MEISQLLLTTFIPPLREGARLRCYSHFTIGGRGRDRMLWLFSDQPENEDKNIMAPASRMVLLSAASWQCSSPPSLQVSTRENMFIMFLPWCLWHTIYPAVVQGKKIPLWGVSVHEQRTKSKLSFKALSCLLSFSPVPLACLISCSRTGDKQSRHYPFWTTAALKKNLNLYSLLLHTTFVIKRML